jgi:hypothetical protein
MEADPYWSIDCEKLSYEAVSSIEGTLLSLQLTLFVSAMRKAASLHYAFKSK